MSPAGIFTALKYPLFILAGLISYCAGSLACRLAGSLALTAAALLCAFLKVSGN